MWSFKTCVCVFLCVVVCVTYTTAQVKQLGLKEGEVCREEGGEKWTCKKPEDCPKASEEDWKKGTRISVCNVEDDKAVICCEPDDKEDSGVVGAKSKEMCEKYAQFVYVTRSGGFFDDDQIVDTCTATEPLIVNGTVAEPREFPHMALVGYKYMDSVIWGCGGSLISERYVLSAAHCTSVQGRPELGPAKVVRLGEYNMVSTDDEYEGKSMPGEYDIVERINHPEYSPPSVYNDIALYRLGKDVVLSEYIRPACLQTDYTVRKEYALATGWGLTTPKGRRSDVLLKVNLTLTPPQDCVDFYQNRRKKTMREGIKSESMVCAGDLASGKDTCNGDSGGPLQVRLEKPYCMYSVIAVTSFGPADCGGGSRPGVYTRVSHYVKWIEDIVWP